VRHLRPLLACLLVVAAAHPAAALDWGHSSDEPLQAQVRAAGQKMTDARFQAWLAGVNRTHHGRRVRRTGWVVEAYAHPSLPTTTTVLVSNRVDLGGVSWTLDLPGQTALRLRPGEQIEWEGAIQRVEPNGDVRLANERVVRVVSARNPGVPEDWPQGWGALRGDQPWWFQTLAERPVVRKVNAQLPAQAIRDGVMADPVVRVWVSPPGHVARAEIARSSGRGDVDLLVIDAVRRWRFQPFPPGRTEDQLGEIVVPVRAF
jgi:TonB family protein